MIDKPAELPIDRWMEEQWLEEDVRAVMKMLRPNRAQRLEGWHEYRTGGTEFRATISWRPEFAEEGDFDGLAVPHMTDVLEAILVGSTRSPDELTPEEEFGIYRRVVKDLYKRLDELESRYH